MSYHCPDCDQELRRCAVCNRFLHPSEVEGKDAAGVYCRTCLTIVRAIAPPEIQLRTM